MKLPHVQVIRGKLFTENPISGYNPFNEDVVNFKDKEYRAWNPNRSKLAAAVMKGVKEIPLKEDNKILYLGAAHGYTPSHIASIVRKGIVYAVEFSERCFNDFLPLTEKFENIVPILADARKTELFNWIEKVDIVYCDIADRQQTDIAIDNCKKFLKEKGYLLLAIKSRSIDVVESPKKIVLAQIEKIKNASFEVIDWKMLDPFEKDHGFVVARAKT